MSYSDAVFFRSRRPWIPAAPAQHSCHPQKNSKSLRRSVRHEVLFRVSTLHISTFDQTLLPAVLRAVLSVTALSPASPQAYLPPITVEYLTSVGEPLPTLLQFAPGDNKVAT